LKEKSAFALSDDLLWLRRGVFCGQTLPAFLSPGSGLSSKCALNTPYHYFHSDSMSHQSVYPYASSYLPRSGISPATLRLEVVGESQAAEYLSTLVCSGRRGRLVVIGSSCCHHCGILRNLAVTYTLLCPGPQCQEAVQTGLKLDTWLGGRLKD
jgi:hypothetical protein